ncbi:MAG: nucleotide exchange factor GrpE [Hyphomicrobiaceae bacterium]
MSDDAKHGGQEPSPAHAAQPSSTPQTPAERAESAYAEQAGTGPEKITPAEERVKELEAQQADLTDRLLRAHAEMDNLRKRTEREKLDGMKYAISKFANDIVGVGDNFQRAIESVPTHALETDPALKAVVEGVIMTERAFMQVLERHGIKRIDPAGQPFDPNLHQAVMEEHNPDVAIGTVLQVFQCGYMLEDRVLRPAMVTVARGGFKPTKPAAAATSENAQNGPTAGGDEPPRE